MILEELQRHAFQGCFHRVDLGQDIDAVAVCLHHALNTAYLPFYSFQPSADLLLVLAVPNHVGDNTPQGYGPSRNHIGRNFPGSLTVLRW